jgi:hypothetical protein
VTNPLDSTRNVKEVESAGAEYLLDAALYLVKKMEIVKNLPRKKALEEVAWWADVVAGELRLRLNGSTPDEQ